MENVTIVECPRDAWQGLAKIIPTQEKVDYLRKLIEAGFRTLDAVSFVAPKYVPQMADSEDVLRGLSELGLLASRSNGHSGALSESPTTAGVEIIGIIVNEQGLKRAISAPGVTTLGYPYSVSANFRRQNANMSQSESRDLVKRLVEAARRSGKKLAVYVSMAFGNPFGEPWSPEVTAEAVEWLKSTGATSASLADTAGVASTDQVRELFREVKPAAAGIELGIHLHSRQADTAEKVLAAFDEGCRRFDGALTGLGGCPFTGDQLVGNLPTEQIVTALAARQAVTGLDAPALTAAVEATQQLRRKYAEA